MVVAPASMVGFDDVVEIGPIGPGGVHRGEFHIVAMRFGPFHRVDSHLQDFIRGFSDHGSVVGRGADKGVDSGIGGAFERLTGAVDVFIDGPGQTADGGAFHLVGNAPHGFKVFIGRDRESGFDHVHVQPGELVGDFHFFPDGEGRSGGLFGIPQGGVENNDTV